MSQFKLKLEQGQSMVEYALLLMLVSGTLFLSTSLLGGGVADNLSRVDFDGGGGSSAEEALTVWLLDQNDAGVASIRIFAYTESGQYTDIYRDTNGQGRTDFELEPGNYQFLAQYQGAWFWSELVKWPSQDEATILIERQAFTVTTIDLSGNPIRGVPVSAYDENGDYLGVTLITNVRGEANFNLIGENVQFRADYETESYPTQILPLAQANTTITLNSCQDGQFMAEYFNNRNLSDDPALIRCETAIQYDWGTAAPADGVNSNNFSVRWTGFVPLDNGTYAFTTTADDGVRVKVNDEMLIDAWRNQTATTYSARKEIDTGVAKVEMFYFENGGQAVAKLDWAPVVTSCPVGQYLADYFNNRDLSGTPVHSQCENQIDYSWGRGSPGNGVNSNNFSVRWRGEFNFDDNVYGFTTTADDGVRVWVDGEPIVDAWVPQVATTYGARKALSAGTHVVQMEYYERGGDTRAYLDWDTVVVSCPTGQFLAEYFNNLDLSGDPVFSRCESQISYDWQNGSPGFGVGANNFSIRWSGTFNFTGGDVTFTTRTDDGVQLYIDQALVINKWRNQAATTYQAVQSLSPGPHDIVMTYYERGGRAVAELDWE